MPETMTLKRKMKDPASLEGTHMVKVTMNLTERDEDNALFIQKATDARSKAQAVSTALSLTRFLIDKMKEDPSRTVVFRARDGSEERLVMTELERARTVK